MLGELSELPAALGLNTVEQVLALSADAAARTSVIKLESLHGQLAPAFATNHRLSAAVGSFPPVTWPAGKGSSTAHRWQDS